MGVRGVIFDLDGVLVDSEERWARAKEDLVRASGGSWKPEAARAMLGMSSPEWSRYLRDELGVPMAPERISAEVVQRLLEDYRRDSPLVDGAAEAVGRLAARWPLGLATSSNREVVDAVLESAGLAESFAATVSSEEVARGKPAPDVYLEAARRLGVAPELCTAVEDSQAGIRSAKSAGMRVVAIPNASYPPDDEALALADTVVRSLDELTVAALHG